MRRLAGGAPHARGPRRPLAADGAQPIAAGPADEMALYYRGYQPAPANIVGIRRTYPPGIGSPMNRSVHAGRISTKLMPDASFRREQRWVEVPRDDVDSLWTADGQPARPQNKDVLYQVMRG